MQNIAGSVRVGVNVWKKERVIMGWRVGILIPVIVGFVKAIVIAYR